MSADGSETVDGLLYDLSSVTPISGLCSRGISVHSIPVVRWRIRTLTFKGDLISVRSA